MSCHLVLLLTKSAHTPIEPRPQEDKGAARAECGCGRGLTQPDGLKGHHTCPALPALLTCHVPLAITCPAHLISSPLAITCLALPLSSNLLSLAITCPACAHLLSPSGRPFSPDLMYPGYLIHWLALPIFSSIPSHHLSCPALTFHPIPSHFLLSHVLQTI